MSELNIVQSNFEHNNLQIVGLSKDKELLNNQIKEQNIAITQLEHDLNDAKNKVIVYYFIILNNEG